MAQYTSVLLRQNLTDQGLLPRTGGWTACPDLIAAGTTPIANPQTVFSSTASMAGDPTQPVVQNAPNYIYLRGTNLGTAATTAEARAFYAPASLFLYPVQWLNNAMKTAKGNTVSQIASIAPNAIGVTTDPLVWTPPTTSEHYCLVGFISTPAVPFASQQPPNAVSSLDDLGVWIGKTGGTGWHNVQWASNSATFSSSTGYPASTKASLIQMAITCTGLPIGAQVSFSCGTPLPDGTVLNLPMTTVQTNGTIGFFIKVNIPAGWSSNITYSYYANGGTPLSTFSLAMSASIISQTPQDSFREFTRPSSEVYPNHQLYDHVAGAFVDAAADMPVDYLIPVGSDVTMLTELAPTLDAA